MATTERLDAAALPSLVIVAVGLVPVVMLCRMLERPRRGGPARDEGAVGADPRDRLSAYLQPQRSVIIAASALFLAYSVGFSASCLNSPHAASTGSGFTVRVGRILEADVGEVALRFGLRPGIRSA